MGDPRNPTASRAPEINLVARAGSAVFLRRRRVAHTMKVLTSGKLKQLAAASSDPIRRDFIAFANTIMTLAIAISAMQSPNPRRRNPRPSGSGSESRGRGNIERLTLAIV